MRSHSGRVPIAAGYLHLLTLGLYATGLVCLILAIGCGAGGSSGGNVSISAPPQTTTVAAGGTLTLTATVTGASNTTVLWSVITSGGGTITAQGVYTAPLTPGTYYVLATAQADSVAKVDFPITVT